MRIRTYYEIYRKKPTTEKVDLLIEEVMRMKDNEYRAYEARFNARNIEDAEYFNSEYHGIRERARWLRWAIMEEIKEVKP